jgi:hypothetical protein
MEKQQTWLSVKRAMIQSMLLISVSERQRWIPPPLSTSFLGAPPYLILLINTSMGSEKRSTQITHFASF